MKRTNITIDDGSHAALTKLGDGNFSLGVRLASRMIDIFAENFGCPPSVGCGPGHTNVEGCRKCAKDWVMGQIND